MAKKEKESKIDFSAFESECSFTRKSANLFYYEQNKLILWFSMKVIFSLL